MTNAGPTTTFSAVPRPSDTVARPHAGSALRGHPIQVVMRRTGLSADVIRAWEKRYGVVAPHRSSSGRRLYSDADVERLRLLARATLTGRTIGQVASLTTTELIELVRADVRADERTPPSTLRTNAFPSVGEMLDECCRAVERLDALARQPLHFLRAPPGADTMVRYGVWATPTFVFVDRRGVVRFYSPTRLTEAELSRRIEAVLAESP